VGWGPGSVLGAPDPVAVHLALDDAAARSRRSGSSPAPISQMAVSTAARSAAEQVPVWVRTLRRRLRRRPAAQLRHARRACISDTSGLPNRTRLPPRLRLRTVATQKVPFL